MNRLPEHLRLQDESPVLRVSCEVINGEAVKQKLVTTDLKLHDDVMNTLVSFGLSEAMRGKIFDLLKSRTGRYGYIRAFDDDTKAYVGVSVTPDPVIHVRMSVGEHEINELVLLMDLPSKIEDLFREAQLPEEIRGSVRERLEGKEQFDQHVLIQQGDERNRVSVRIGHVNSNGFTEYPTSDKKKKWRGMGG